MFKKKFGIFLIKVIPLEYFALPTRIVTQIYHRINIWHLCLYYLTYVYVFFFINRWYFRKIKRIEAEKKLLLPENEHGAFLIRDSESRHNDYSLSGTMNIFFCTLKEIKKSLLNQTFLSFSERWRYSETLSNSSTRWRRILYSPSHNV